MIRTVKVKVDVPRDRALETLRLSADVFNFHTGFAIQEKTFNKNKLHAGCYRRVRELYPQIPSGLVQTIRDTASEAVKAVEFKSIPTKKPQSAIRFDRRNFTVRGNDVTFSLIGGRHKTTVFVPPIYKDMWAKGRPASATLNFDKGQNQFYLNVVFELPDAPMLPPGDVEGIDRGMINLAVTSSGKFHPSKGIRSVQRRMLYNKRKLQSKGTRSAKRRLKAMRRKEQRFQRDRNHCVTKRIVASPATTFAIEDLSKIRVNSSRKGRNWNQRFNRWAFFQFELFLVYKADALGKSVVKVNARFTSQDCSVCHARGNRIKSRFECPLCGHKEHADLNAAKVIRNRHLSSLLENPVGEAGRTGRNNRRIVNRPPMVRNRSKSKTSNSVQVHVQASRARPRGS